MLQKRLIAGPLAIAACLAVRLGLSRCEDRRDGSLTNIVGNVKGYTPSEVAAVASAMVEAAQFYQPNQSVCITIVDREGRILFQGCTVDQSTGNSLQSVASAANLAIIDRSTSRAGTASYLSSEGEIFSTDTAFFIIQENFPPGTKNEDVGPLFGVENSSFVASDIIRFERLPLAETGRRF
jgi:hypothetical protein